MTWGERTDTRLHAKDSAAQECMAIVRALAAERDTLQGLLRKSLERECEIEKELDEAREQVAVLRGAMETAVDYLYNPFEPENQCAQYKSIKNTLETTPSEASERVQKLAELLQDAVSETENAERLSEGFCSAAKAALSEWRRDK